MKLEGINTVVCYGGLHIMSSLNHATKDTPPVLSQVKAEEVAKSTVRKGYKTNKRRVTMTFTPEKIYITDMIYSVSTR